MHFAPDELAGLPESRDRRARVRRSISAVSYLEVGEGNGGIVMNVSETGLAIALAQPVVDVSTLKVNFRLPDLERTFQASGQIMWQSDSKRSAGLRFLNLTEYDRAQIRNWIRAEIVATELQTPRREPLKAAADAGAGAASTTAARPVLIMPSPRKVMRDIEADSARDEARAAEFDRMFPSEATLNLGSRVEAEGHSDIAEAAKYESAANALLAGEAILARVDDFGAGVQTEVDADAGAADFPAVDDLTSVPEIAAETAAVEEAQIQPQAAAAPQQLPHLDDVVFGDWRDEWERFHRERENLERANVARALPDFSGVEPAAEAGKTGNRVFGWQQAAVPEKDDVTPVAAEIPAAELKSTVAPPDVIAEDAAHLVSRNAPVMRNTVEAARVVMPWDSPEVNEAIPPARAERTSLPVVAAAEPMAATAGGPIFTGLYPAAREREKVPAALAAKTETAKNPLDIGALLIALVIVCFVLGYAIQPGAFRFLRSGSNDAETGTTAVKGAEAAAQQNSAPSPAVDAQNSGAASGSTAPASTESAVPVAPTALDKSSNETIRPEVGDAVGGSTPTVAAKSEPPAANSAIASTSPVATPTSPAGAANSPAPQASVTQPAVVPAPAASTPSTAATPTASNSAPPANPTITAPVPVSFFPVVAPSGGSAPKLMQLPEETVYDTPAILVKAREMVFVPALPGPESEHELERVHVGDRTLKVEPTHPQTNSANAAGTVHLRSTIAPDGSISDVQAISGPTNLIPSAVAAVRQWRYKPTDIDGKAIAVEEDITIEFRATHAS